MSSSNCPVSALEYAMKILAKRVYAESEIYTKLRKKNYPPDEIKNAIDECKRYSFINDELYAQDYANLLNSRGCGSMLVRRKLSMLRIAPEYIDRALEMIAENEMSAAEHSFDFKMRMLAREKNPLKKRQKIYAFMVSRGYSLDIIKKLFEKYEDEI